MEIPPDAAIPSLASPQIIQALSSLLRNAFDASDAEGASEFVWPDDRVAHIARHGVAPDEVEQACFDEAMVRGIESEGPNPVYHVLGETEAGRHLFCVVILFPEGRAFPVTARDMTDKEKIRYREWKK